MAKVDPPSADVESMDAASATAKEVAGPADVEFGAGGGDRGEQQGTRARVLVVDDELLIQRVFRRALNAAGHQVDVVGSVAAAEECLRTSNYDVVVSDLVLPETGGMELLRHLRADGRRIPFVIVTGSPDVDSAIEAVRLGAVRYLTKPLLPGALERAVSEVAAESVDAGLRRRFESAIQSIRMMYQPIVCWSTRSIHAYEALVRPGAGIEGPAALFDAAERLSTVRDLGRVIRCRVAADAAQAPELTFYVNLHPLDLLDEDLVDPAAPLSQMASRVVLEITERATLDRIGDLHARIAALRQLGFRIAIDDLGSGYSGLSSVAELEPEVVKLDMSLVRGIERAPTKMRLVRAMVVMLSEMGRRVVAEGVETEAERDALVAAGCDLLQGYLFARPAPPPFAAARL